MVRASARTTVSITSTDSTNTPSTEGNSSSFNCGSTSSTAKDCRPHCHPARRFSGERCPDRIGGGGLRTTHEYDLSNARWRKSSYGVGSGASCLEVIDGVPGVGPVRDSKVPDGHVLLIGAVAWTEFVGAVEASAVSR
ncbi:DUF397 domain-containing protein [Streptomyces sp. NPDC050508]|uniref:DUF397 domain-containing protein n=1 Tax=Streptomyces sp. NPDC050508 TaxID=3155405 RepID=UPI00344AF2F2